MKLSLAKIFALFILCLASAQAFGVDDNEIEYLVHDRPLVEKMRVVGQFVYWTDYDAIARVPLA